MDINNKAITVENISKTFRIPHENRDTIRERLFNLRRKTTYEAFNALSDLSFEVSKGEFFGIIGRNGSGKSTLLKILAGVYTPDKGKVMVNGDISPFLELGVGFNPELSGKDNIYLNATLLGLSKKEIQAQYKAIVDFSELDQFIDLKLKNYSSGMYVRLAFSVAIHANKGILLMDEVLAVGDSNFQAKCLAEFNRYKEMGNTVILVTHDIQTVKRSCDHALLLQNGNILKIGNAAEVCEEYEYQNMSDDEKRQYLENKNTIETDIEQDDTGEIIATQKIHQVIQDDIEITIDKKSDTPGVNINYIILSDDTKTDSGNAIYFVKCLYNGLLGRDPDPEGLQYWVNEMNNGMAEGTVFTKIFNSEEYNRNFTLQQNKDLTIFNIVTFLKEKLSKRTIIVVDVGSQNMSNEEHIYSHLLKHSFKTKVIRLEPNLISRGEREILEKGYELVIHDSFVGDGEEYLFHINDPDSTSSLLPFNTGITSSLFGLHELKTLKTESVRTDTLDELLDSIESIDLLKLDLQGFELNALQNAQKILSKTLIIHCQISFVEIYKGQSPFSDVDRFLRSHGFQFIDFHYECRYPFLTNALVQTKDQLGWGDAIYIKEDGLKNTEESLIIQSLIVLLCYNKVSLAASIAEKYDLLSGNSKYGTLFNSLV